MTLPAAEMERIVREVLRRLQTATGPPAASRGATGDGAAVGGATPTNGELASAAAARKAEEGTAGDPSASAARLVVSQRLVTCELLRDRWNGVRELVVPADALLTPLVRDELKQRGIRLVREANPRDTASVRPEILLGLCGRDDGQLPLLVNRAGYGIRETLQGTPADVIGRLAAALPDSGGRAILVTRQAAVAVALANRYRTLRAAWGVSPEAVGEALQALAPNLLVLHPAARQRTEMVRRFLQDGGPGCPVWKELLDATGEAPLR